MAGKKKKKTPAKVQKKQGTDLNNMTVKSTAMASFKVRRPVRIAVIILSVLALSLFFEGYRQIKQGATFPHVSVFVLGIICTAVLLYIQAFWIYLEEKYKGTLRRKFAHFEQMEEYWQKKRNLK